MCLLPGSSLEAMFSGRHELNKLDGKIYLDRDPKIFSYLISYLKNNMQLSKIKDEYEAE